MTDYTRHMDFVERARIAVETALPAFTTDPTHPIRADLDAGEEVAALIDLLLEAPQLIEADVVDELERFYEPADTSVFARVARRAVAQYRELNAA